MKRFIAFIIIIYAMAYKCHAQLVVTDPAALKVSAAGWSKTLSEAVAQSKILMDTKSILTESINMYNKVSTTVQNIQTITNMIDRQVWMIKTINDQLSRQDINDIRGYKKHVESLQNLLAQTNSTIRMVQTLLSPTVQMTQGERLNLIIDLEKQTKEQEQQMRVKINLYNKMNQMIKRYESLEKSLK